ncbi:MBL fold metallo-hydrolase [Salinicola sp. LHM]|uniref:MBL fold metallo-hydrolase n=1 Tax=unclassified Salinicola TaxID=2634022 RepID=UPI0008DD6211|nr:MULTISPECIES: MBL fold metallo-hydrolase [unclassified Salinicola]OHZ03314.1 MBL fold metallo-hydrolase [Salinicola sp. MIT1003]WQH32387.1 MBL fold metallo-hydrolase [Salinicola sp. LHM]
MRNHGFICATCGVQYPSSESPPEHCAICEDERQYVPIEGQQWTTPSELAAGHSNLFRHMAPGLTAIGTVPHFAIGQRAFLLRTPAGNVLWDCLTLLDEATIEIIEGLGGLDAIVLSHPHYFSTMAEWGQAFDCPVYVHAADRDWVTVPDARIEFWEGESREILPGIDVYRLGGHFPGASVLHWPEHEILLTGDTLLITPDRMASFMWSYPNNIPLDAGTVESIAQRLRPIAFDSAYSAFWGREILIDAKHVIEESAQRHCRALRGQPNVST